jgi:hypothetical protein
VVGVGSRAEITGRDLEVLTFAAEQFGLPLGLVAELAGRHAAGTLAPAAAVKTSATRASSSSVTATAWLTWW